MRTLKLGSVGADVVVAKKAVYAGLKLVKLVNPTPVFGVFFRSKVKEFQKKKGIAQTGVIGPATWTALKPYIPKPVVPALVYPHPREANTPRPTYLHPTGGISGNWALDFMAPGGTPVLSPEDGTISRISGHDPKTGTHSPGDVFGWNIYITAKNGWYFSTHYGSYTVSAGEKVRAGQQIGTVGHWPNDPGRSHTHLGFTHADGTKASAVSHIKAVAAAPKVSIL